MIRHRAFRFMIAFLLAGFFLTVTLTADELKVIFKNKPNDIYNIKSFKQGSLIYCSLDDLSELLSIKKRTTDESKVLELDFKKNVIRILPNSSFICIRQKSNNQIKTLQMPFEFIPVDNDLYFPIKSFLPVLNESLKTSIVHDIEKERLIINSSISANSVSDKGEAVSNLSISKKSNGYTIKIPLNHKVKYNHSFNKAENILSVKINGVNVNSKISQGNKHSDFIDKITVSKYPNSSEILFSFNQDFESYDLFQSDKTKDLYLLIFQKFSLDSMFKAEKRRNKIKELAELEKKRKKWKLDAVVIDPGHGGVDPGCIGITKKYEKNIVLPIALKLGKLLESKLKLKVYYTRKTDTFIPIYRRGQIANEKKGDLFISIHCNAVPKNKSNINGFESYILKPGRTEDAIAVAERENAVIKYEEDYENRYKHLSDENFILTAIAQNAYVKFSETFAEIISDNVSSGLNIKNRGVHQAGFYVLVGASMPSVLLECGYLSNKNDESFLSSAGGQQKIADCIFKAIKDFISTYEKSLREGK